MKTSLTSVAEVSAEPKTGRQNQTNRRFWVFMALILVTFMVITGLNVISNT